MSIISSVILLLLTSGATWILWQCIRYRSIRQLLERIPGPPSQSFWTGNVIQFSARNGMVFEKEVAQNYGPVVKISGLFGHPILYVYDLKALQTIIKDQDIYEESNIFIKTSLLLFGPGLFSTLGDHHRQQRKLLNPVFSPNHMRHLLPMFYDVVHNLRDAIVFQVVDGHGEIDMLHWMGRASLELIGQGILGYSFDPMVKDASDALGNALKTLSPTMHSVVRLHQMLPYVSELGPAWFRRRMLEIVPSRQLQKLKRIVDTIAQRSSEIFSARRSALQRGDESLFQQVGQGKDIMSILIKANMEATQTDKLGEDEMIAQMSTMLFAGTDTTSSIMARILHLLAQHPDVQEKLRQELLHARKEGDLGYDELVQLPYLDAVCRETLRVEPPVSIAAMREPRRDAVLPLSEPICGTDGRMIQEIPIPKGTTIIIGILGCNINKALWGEDAHEWKPERWLSPLPPAVDEARIPGVYSKTLTFLGGGRSCIGFKFAELEMKAVLSVLLSTFSFELTDDLIVWNLANVNYPTAGKGNMEVKLPLKVTLLKSACAQSG
ncbi:hypothetical protein AcV7_006386 [Taiwanofungus camphoratus]|nr:hypothetical protein AcV7_006386 [Antrodia cinnamomea]